MKLLFSYIKKQPHLLILGLILLIGLFFRTYKIVDRFEFSHDADLYSWIVKDIVIDHHLRLIGQLTSAPGIFIGPFFYYLLVPFFLLTKMDPVGVLIPITLLGILTIISYYFVLSKLFNKQTGLIAAFLYAILTATVNSDRWVVPTVTTSIWAIWYFYTIVNIARGKLFVLPILGILIGLVWDIHIALIPTLLAIPVAIFVSKKIPTLKHLLSFFIPLVIISTPLVFFELRHNFQQTTGLIQNFLVKHDGLTEFAKLIRVLEMITQNTNALFFAPQSFKFTQNLFFLIIILTSPLILLKKKILSLKDLLPMYAWILGTILFFSISSAPISEYYFSNIEVIFIAFISLLFVSLMKRLKKSFYVILVVLLIILLKNTYFLITQGFYHKGYLEKKAIIDTIKRDSTDKGYPCIGISYITAPGENVGFRYLFYLNNIHLNHPSVKIPVYNIVIPDELSKEVEKKFGHIGIILPKENFAQEDLEKNCANKNTNLTDTVFGFVK